MNKMFVLLTMLLPLCCYSQWLDNETLQATVLIEKSEFQPHGTGFLLYNYKNPQDYIVVTCAHLIKNRKQVFVRMNIDTLALNDIPETNKINGVYSSQRNWGIVGNSLIIRIDLSTNPKAFIINDSLDIGAFHIDIPYLLVENDTTKKAIKFSKKLGIPKSGLKYKNELALGDEVYFIGFPFGIGAKEIIAPIVRSGSIAWLLPNYPEFLLDSFSFGGNSGSPVFCKMLLGTKIGELQWHPPKLIGMIVGHHGLKLENILTQPNPNDLKFEKGTMEMNLGLARCVYIDDIIKIVEQLLSN